MNGQSKPERLSNMSAAGKERVVSALPGRTCTESDTPTGEPTTDRSSASAMTRRTYLVAAGAASVAAVPAVSASEGSQYGEGGYGLQSYGGSS